MEEYLNLTEWLRHHLRLKVSVTTRQSFLALSEEERAYILDKSDDAIRMFLIVMEHVVESGGHMSAAEAVLADGKKLGLKIEGQFVLTFDGEEYTFNLNHYGQMQLDQWLHRYL